MVLSESPSAQSEELVVDVVDNLQERAARNAVTVGAFKTAFQQNMQEVLRTAGSDGISHQEYAGIDVRQLRNLSAQRQAVIDAGAEGNEHLRLATQDENTLGSNIVGGGDGSAILNEDRFATMVSMEDAEEMAHAGEHEKAHGEQVPMDIRLLEGHAEIRANLARGHSMEYRRSGQPRELYGEGQDLILCAAQHLSWQRVDAIMTGKGDPAEIMAAIQEDSEQN
ncbi:MAG: hypothetical protein WCX61_04575 [Candidatus Peribacteraceae bacterium]